FFFQAEDGIRDRNVTGVQTCALPIFFALLSLVPNIHGCGITDGTGSGDIFENILSSGKSSFKNWSNCSSESGMLRTCFKKLSERAIVTSADPPGARPIPKSTRPRSEEHTSELQSRFDLVCRLLLEKKK